MELTHSDKSTKEAETLLSKRERVGRLIMGRGEKRRGGALSYPLPYPSGMAHYFLLKQERERARERASQRKEGKKQNQTKSPKPQAPSQTMKCLIEPLKHEIRKKRKKKGQITRTKA